MIESDVSDLLGHIGDVMGIDTYDIIIEIDEDLDVQAELEHIYDYDAVLTISPNISNEELKRCIIHELTHYKQHVEGRLVNSHLKVYWEGVKYESVDFINSPWEVEAYENEEKYLKLL